MRTQSPSQFQFTTLTNLEILFRVLLPALFVRTSAATEFQFFSANSLSRTDSVLRQFICKNGRHIQKAWICDGDDDCGDNSDETALECRDRYNCREDQFTCRNGVCISLALRCDKERDCADGSDEDPDICSGCSQGEIECKPGHCIPHSWQCDGKHDCDDGRDERNCNITCNPHEFTCANGRCITKEYLCDLDDDCGDNSDEKNCTIKPQCSSDTDFQCGDRNCIPRKFVCDGDYDCSDKSDEKNCPSKKVSVSKCFSDEFLCSDRQTCIKSYLKCDGEADCPDGSDENKQLCENVTCNLDQFKCNNHQCIEAHMKCNGVTECTDGSDEEGCPEPTVCKNNEFDCGDGSCIDIHKVCNKIRDCPNGRDEPQGKCGVNECLINNGGCSDICTDTPTGHRCSCRAGYKVVNNTICVDINECDYPGSCSQKCINEIGKFRCECEKGYDVDPLDKTRCVAKGDKASLIFTRNYDIKSVRVDGVNLTTIVNGTHMAKGLSFLYKNNTIFWSDNADNKIYSTVIGTNSIHNRYGKGKVIINDTGVCDGVAVDWIYNHIYWTDTGKDIIGVSNLNGTMRKTLIKDKLIEPRAIVVNPLEGWMFWTDWGNEGRIERAGLDGSLRSTIVSHEVRWPNGLTLDLVNRRIYWVDAKLNSISSADYDGSRRTVILRSYDALHHPFSIAVFEDTVYWTDWDKMTVFKANKFNGLNVEIVSDAISSQLQNPMVVQVHHPYIQPNGTNYCENASCSHFCFPRPHVSSIRSKVSCSCPDGLILQDDRTTCADSTPVRPTIALGDTPTDEYNDLVTVVVDGKSDNENSASAKDPGAGVVSVLLYIIAGSLVTIIPLCFFFAYRYYSNRNVTRITFDFPDHFKSAGGDFDQVKTPFRPSPVRCSLHSEDEQKPLKTPTTNDYM